MERVFKIKGKEIKAYSKRDALKRYEYKYGKKMKLRILECLYKGNVKSYRVQRKIMFFWVNCKIHEFTVERDAEFPAIQEAEEYIDKLIKSMRIIEKRTIVKTIITSNEDL